jgi:hypothetical protein
MKALRRFFYGWDGQYLSNAGVVCLQTNGTTRNNFLDNFHAGFACQRALTDCSGIARSLPPASQPYLFPPAL